MELYPRTRSKTRSQTSAIEGHNQIGKAKVSKSKPVKKSQSKTEQAITGKGGRIARESNKIETFQAVELSTSKKHNVPPMTRSKQTNKTSDVEDSEIKTSTDKDHEKTLKSVEGTGKIDSNFEEVEKKTSPFNEAEVKTTVAFGKIVDETRKKTSTIVATVNQPLSFKENEDTISNIKEIVKKTPTESQNLGDVETKCKTEADSGTKINTLYNIESEFQTLLCEVESSSLAAIIPECTIEEETEVNTLTDKETKLQILTAARSGCKTPAEVNTESCVTNNLENITKIQIKTPKNEELGEFKYIENSINKKNVVSIIPTKVETKSKNQTLAEQNTDFYNSVSENSGTNVKQNEKLGQLSNLFGCHSTKESASERNSKEVIVTVHNKAYEMLKNKTSLETTNEDNTEYEVKDTAVEIRCKEDSPILKQKQEKVFIGLDNSQADFHLLTRLLGPGGQNLEFLQIQTKARVDLHGKGSLHPSAEPLHFLVRHDSSEGLQEAVLLVQNLVDTVQKEFELHCAEKQETDLPVSFPWMKTTQLEPPGVSPTRLPSEKDTPQKETDPSLVEVDEHKNSSKDMTGECDMEIVDERENNDELTSNCVYSEKVYVGLGDVPADFGLLNQLLGPSGSNIEYLQTQTNSDVELRGNGSPNQGPHSEPLHFFVRHTSSEGLQKAVQLIQNLISTVGQNLQQCWMQTQLMTNIYPSVPVPPWPMMYPQSLPMPGPISTPNPPTSLLGPMPPQHTPFKFVPPPGLMEFTSLLQRTTVTTVLQQQQTPPVPPENQATRSKSNLNTHLNHESVKVGSGISVKKKFEQFQLVRRKAQEIQERWKNRQAANQSTDTIASKQTDIIKDLVNDLKSEAKLQMKSMPPGFLRNQFLKICHLSDEILCTKDLTCQHSLLSTLNDHLKKFFLFPNSQKFHNIKPMYLTLQKAFTDLSHKLNIPQLSTMESIEGTKQFNKAQIIEDDFVVSSKEKQADCQRNRSQACLFDKQSEYISAPSPANQRDSDRLKSSHLSRFDNRANKSKDEEKSKLSSAKNRSDSVGSKQNFPSRFEDRLNNSRSSSFHKASNNKWEQLPKTSLNETNPRNHKPNVQTQFDDIHLNPSYSFQKPAEENLQPHSNKLATGYQSRLSGRYFESEENTPEESPIQKAKALEKTMEQKIQPMLSTVVMHLHEEVSQYAKTLPGGFEKIQLEQILSMLKDAPFALVLNDDQRTELKAILLLLKTTLKKRLLQDQPDKLINQLKLFEECLKCQTDLKSSSQEGSESIMRPKGGDRNQDDFCTVEKNQGIKLTSGQKKRVQKLVRKGVPREEAKMQVLQSSDSQISLGVPSERSASSENLLKTSSKVEYKKISQNLNRLQEYPKNYTFDRPYSQELDKSFNENNIKVKTDLYEDDVWMEYDDDNVNSGSPEQFFNCTNLSCNLDTNIQLSKNTLKEEPQFRHDLSISYTESGSPSTPSYQRQSSISKINTSDNFRLDEEMSQIKGKHFTFKEYSQLKERHSDYYSSQTQSTKKHNDMSSHHNLEENFQELFTDRSINQKQYFHSQEDARQPNTQSNTTDSISLLTYKRKKNLQVDDPEIYSRRTPYPDPKRQHEDEYSYEDFDRKTIRPCLNSTEGRHFLEEELDNNDHSFSRDLSCSSTVDVQIPDSKETSHGGYEEKNNYFHNTNIMEDKRALDLFDVPSNQQNIKEVRPELRERYENLRDYVRGESIPRSNKQGRPVSRWDIPNSTGYEETGTKLKTQLNSSPLKRMHFIEDETSLTSTGDPKNETTRSNINLGLVSGFSGSKIPNKKAKIEQNQIISLNQPKKNKKKRKASEVILSIMDVDYPKVLLTYDQLVEIKTLLGFKSIYEFSPEIPRFNLFVIKLGHLLVMCRNKDSADLTKATVGKLKLQNEAILYAVEKARMNKPILILVYFPNSSQYPDDKILKLLSIQNKDLNTTAWTVVNRVNEQTYARLIISVDLETIEKIKNGLPRVFYRFGQIKFKLYEPKRRKQSLSRPTVKAQTSGSQKTQKSKIHENREKDLGHFNLEDY